MNRKQFDIQQKRSEIFERDGYMCRACGESIHRFGSMCCAHGIHKSATNLKKFGDEIVNSKYNLYSCCGGWHRGVSCNDSLNVGVANEEKEARRIKRLIEDEIT